MKILIMKKQILILFLIFSFPLTIFAHGGSPAMFTIIGYVFLFPIIIGLFENYFIKSDLKIEKVRRFKIILANSTITLLGYFIAFYFVDNFNVKNENLALALIMIVLTAIQLISKTLLYSHMIRVEKTENSRINRFIFLETVIVNAVFYVIIIILP